MSKALRLALLVGAVALPVAARSQGPEPERVTQFGAGAEREEMRYQHLWIAYASIWLVSFGLALATWRRQQANQSELHALDRRLKELEGDHGR